jgi:hypothetical protein
MASKKNQLRVLSRNLYLGADLEPVAAAALSGDEQGVVTKATEFWNQVQTSDFPTRAEAFAAEIAAKQPHLVGLQEVSLYRTGQSISEEATDVQFDFLQILLNALERQGANYKAVSVHQAFDGQLPAFINEGELGSVRLTDHDVILMRTDLPAKSFKLAKSKAGAYEAQLDLVTGLDVSRGWTAADVKLNGERIRFVTRTWRQVPRHRCRNSKRANSSMGLQSRRNAPCWWATSTPMPRIPNPLHSAPTTS